MIVHALGKMAHTILRGGVMKRSERREHTAQDQREKSVAGETEGAVKTAGEKRISLAEEQFDRWLESMERLRLAEYVRYVDDRRRLFWSSFWSGIARGVGMAIGFTILGAMLILILQDLARHNLPLIGELLDEIMNVVQNGMK